MFAISSSANISPPAPEPQTTPLTELHPGGDADTLTLAPNSTALCTIDVPSGMTVAVTLREEQGTVSVTWTDPAGNEHVPRTNRGGQDATVRFTLIGGNGGRELLRIAAPAGKRPFRVVASAEAPRPTETADAAVVAAEEALAQGDWLWSKHDRSNAKQALAAYDAAISGAERLGEVSMQRRSLTWKGVYLAFTLSDAVGAMPLLLHATQLPDAGDLVEQANAWKTLGFVETTLADYPGGWSDYARALDLFRKTGDRFNIEVMLDNRGKLSKMTGDYGGALKDAEAASSIAQELGDRTGVLHMEDDIGSIHMLRGELQLAFDAYQEVERGLETIDPVDPMIGFVDTDLAQLYQELGANARARDMMDRADAFWKAHPYIPGQLSTLILEGKLENDGGNLAASASRFEQGLNLAASASMQREQIFCLLGLANVDRKRKNYPEAEANFNQAWRLAKTIDESDSFAQIRVGQGDLAMAMGHADAAASLYQQALTIARESFDHSDTIAALGGLARAEIRLGMLTAARLDIESALNGIESTREFVAVGSLKTAYFSSRHSYYEVAVQLLMRLHRLHPQGGYDREALLIAERARARFLLDQLEQSGSRPESRTDKALAAERESVLRQLRLTESSLVELRKDTSQSHRVARLQSQVAGLLEQEDRIEAEMSREQPSLPFNGAELSDTHLDAKQSLLNLRQVLGPASALLEYWAGGDASYLWVVTENAIHSYELPRAAVLQGFAADLSAEVLAPFRRSPASAEDFAESLNSNGEHFRATSLELARLVLPTGAIPRSVHTLLVVGDGPLLSVPFEELRIVSENGKEAYLQDRYCVAREPSIAVLLSLVKQKEDARTVRIAVIADPVYSLSDPRIRAGAEDTPGGRLASNGPADADEQTAWVSVAGVNRLQRLYSSAAEARDIVSLAGPRQSREFTGFAAGLRNIEDIDWADISIAHFATHAWMNSTHPELAGVALSMYDRSGHAQAGVLWYSDIARLRMPVDLVTLSACQTANGEPMPGEGLVGLSYSFFLAGARRVVGSLWNVDDTATRALMREFYTALLKGHNTPAEALRAAQRKIASTSGWSNPYYWAGFTIEGDWNSIPQELEASHGANSTRVSQGAADASGIRVAAARSEPRPQ
ncbi:MAG: CHAT domain-containing protein [Acidobacteriota bacterium]